MRIATYRHQGQAHVGVVSDDLQTITALSMSPQQAALGALPLIEAISAGSPMPDPSGPAIPINELQLLAPLPKPRRNLFCVGRNYHAHARELSSSVFKEGTAHADEWPIVFTKVPECVIGPQEPVAMPVGVSEQIDYEAELVVVIGRGGKNISRSEAMAHVFGYTIANDVTARDVQMRHGHWDLGKSFDTFCPLGPWIVTADAMDGRRSRVRCWVNGELRQDSATENMIFDIPALIEHISRGITLYPGDLIATGTPAGVGMGMKPARWLRAGDVVRIEVDGIGQLEHAFV